MKTPAKLLILLWASSTQAAPYDWQNNPMIVDQTPKYEAPYRAYTEKNPYQPGTRTKDNRGNVWYTDVNPYNKEELRTIKIH